MGATHKETVTELVKGMIQANHIKADSGSKHPARDILKKAIMLVEYGVRIYRDPETIKLVEDGYNKEKQNSKAKVTNDLNSLKKKK